MKRYLYILAATIFCGCNYNIPTDPDDYTPTIDPFLSFTYERIAPMMYDFSNQSSGYISYEWDFGNGMFSYGTDATITYETPGSYTVTLTGTDKNGTTDKIAKRIDVTKPTPYIAGYTLYHIPYEARYYRVIFKDDALLPSSWDFSTAYSPLLYNVSVPYTYELKNPHTFDDLESHTYYTIQVMRNTSTTNPSADVQCLKQQIKVSEILNYQPEYMLQTESGATSIGIIMGYYY